MQSRKRVPAKDTGPMVRIGPVKSGDAGSRTRVRNKRP